MPDPTTIVSLTAGANRHQPVAIIPCRNEQGSIEQLVADLQRIGFAEVIVSVDPNSSDETASLATARGATVVRGASTGYDGPCLAALEYLRNLDYRGDIVFLDAGNKYVIESIGEMLQQSPVDADIVFGLRDSAMMWHQRLGNAAFRTILFLRFRQRVLDISSVRLMSMEVANELQLVDRQFSLPFQTVVNALALGKRIHYVPIRCRDERIGDSKVSGSPRNSAKAAKQMLVSLAKAPKKKPRETNP
jgi:glycosyltransferase involved in cell wall biosynthesis